MYGNVVGDIALRYLPYGGIYLVGGITESLSDYIVANQGLFMKDYVKLRSYVDIAWEKIPVYIVKGEMGLKGAFVVS